MIPLAEAFELEIRSNDTYVRVPSHLAYTVERLTGTLMSSTLKPDESLLDKVLRQFEKLNASRAAEVLDFMKVAEAWHGNSPTPIEDFIVNLPVYHLIRPLTPDCIESYLNECRENFEAPWISPARSAISTPVK